MAGPGNNQYPPMYMQGRSTPPSLLHLPTQPVQQYNYHPHSTTITTQPPHNMYPAPPQHYSQPQVAGYMYVPGTNPYVQPPPRMPAPVSYSQQLGPTNSQGMATTHTGARFTRTSLVTSHLPASGQQKNSVASGPTVTQSWTPLTWIPQSITNVQRPSNENLASNMASVPLRRNDQPPPTGSQMRTSPHSPAEPKHPMRGFSKGFYPIPGHRQEQHATTSRPSDQSAFRVFRPDTKSQVRRPDSPHGYDVQEIYKKFTALLAKHGPLEPTHEHILNLFISLTTFERKLIMAQGSIKGFLRQCDAIEIQGNILKLRGPRPSFQFQSSQPPEVNHIPFTRTQTPPNFSNFASDISDSEDSSSVDSWDDKEDSFQIAASQHGISVKKPKSTRSRGSRSRTSSIDSNCEDPIGAPWLDPEAKSFEPIISNLKEPVAAPWLTDVNIVQNTRQHIKVVDNLQEKGNTLIALKDSKKETCSGKLLSEEKTAYNESWSLGEYISEEEDSSKIKDYDSNSHPTKVMEPLVPRQGYVMISDAIKSLKRKDKDETVNIARTLLLEVFQDVKKIGCAGELGVTLHKKIILLDSSVNKSSLNVTCEEFVPVKGKFNNGTCKDFNSIETKESSRCGSEPPESTHSSLNINCKTFVPKTLQYSFSVPGSNSSGRPSPALSPDTAEFIPKKKKVPTATLR